MSIRFIMSLLVLVLAGVGQAQTTTYKATVTWDDALNPAGVVYAVNRAPGDCTGTPVFASRATGLTSRTFVDQPLQPGKYCYQVVASVEGAAATNNPTKDGTVPAFGVSNIGITIQLTITP